MTAELLQMTLSAVYKEETTKPCYNKLDMSPELIHNTLSKCITDEVKSRRDTIVQSNDALKSVATWLSRSTNKPFLIIYGKVGNGKTTTVRAIKRLYDILKKGADKIIKNPYMLTNKQEREIEQLQALHAPLVVSAQDICTLAQIKIERFEEARKHPFLVIDDVGIEPTKIMHYGTERSPIADIIFWRYEKRYITILTTNKTFDELCDIYGDRIADRLNECASRIGYEAKSYR